MATKAEIKAAIQEKLTGSATDLTWARHEEFLIDEVDSILENVYGTAVIESNVGVNTITTANSNFDYRVVFTKQGRNVNLRGYYENVSGSTLNNQEVFSLQATQYSATPLEAVRGISILQTFGSTDVNEIRISGTSFISGGLINNGERFYFNFNYNSAD